MNNKRQNIFGNQIGCFSNIGAKMDALDGVTIL